MDLKAPSHDALTTKLPAWSPTSWRQFPALQQAEYTDLAALESALGRLRRLPPLVTSWEVERLRERFADAAEGRYFILQGGDCAETLDACTPETIVNKLKILLQMSLVLANGLKRPIIRVARIAGQYAKPRSSPTETRVTAAGEVTLPSYLGDLVNRPDFTPEARRNDPELMIQCYQHAAMTLNFIRALIDGGFADLHHPEQWELSFLQTGTMPTAIREQYRAMTASIANAVEFLEAVGETRLADVARVEVYTSHEALHLPYEESLTRAVPRRAGHYNLSCHMPWIGERTRSLDGAHIEYARGLRNPVGVKVGPKTTADDLRALIDRLDPAREPGKLALIGRFGALKVADTLPRLIEASRYGGRRLLWLCDPMHGNTESTASGRKTRRFEAILSELASSIDIHAQCGSVLGGVHFELTGDNVAECLGGASNVTEADFDQRYETACDPRLNYDQAMEMAFAIAARMGPARRAQISGPNGYSTG